MSLVEVTWITSSALTPYVTSSSLTTTLGSYVLTTALSSYVTSASLTITLGGYVTSSSLTTTLSGYVTNTAVASYMPRAGGTFSGDVSLSTYSLRFINPSSVERILTPTILEALFSKYNTWLTVTPTTLPATTFTGDITCNTQTVLGTSTLTLTILEYVISITTTG